MLKGFRKILSLILVLAMILPSGVFAEELNRKNPNTILQNEEKTIEDIIQLIMSVVEHEDGKEELVEDIGNEDVVRIIVELDEKPIIVKANDLGLRYSFMSDSKANDLEANLLISQNAIKSLISNRVNMEFDRSYTTVFNGFSGQVKFQDINIIEKVRGVKKVYISQEYDRPIIEPNMNTSHDMIGSYETWTKYKGEGTVVAIIDTGIDVTHKDFIPKLTEGYVNGIAGLKGKFYTEKVPYGYNYYDLNHTILDIGPGASEHGMHVAGTVTANGDTDNGGIKGVAPESQVLAMKVFSNDPIYATTFDDIYLAAIDDAVKLKADVLNMSLGSTASFYIAESAVDRAITNATNDGIVCSISAGNSAYLGEGYYYPLIEDPDYGVVGAPSLSKDSISVASIENENISANYLEYRVVGVAEVLPRLTVIIGEEAFDADQVNSNSSIRRKVINAINHKPVPIPVFLKLSDTRFNDAFGISIGSDLSILPKIVTYTDKYNNVSQRSVLPGGTTGETETFQVPMAIAGSIIPSETFSSGVEFVNCGIGNPEDFTGKDLSGKIALIIRGVLPFTEKIMNAQNAGAAGVIIYNSAVGGSELISMQYPPQGNIPAVAIGHADGVALLELTENVVTFPLGTLQIPNANGGKMSDFTSWGTTPTLELKPEITAPGGKIYSTLQNNKYGTMSGTSMAAPHISGGSALVMQYIREQGLKTDPSEQTRFAKALLMNTAKIVIDEEAEAPYSPRRQGAGIMNLNAAVTTPAVVLTSNGEAKVELKDFDARNFSINLTVKNLTSDVITYNIESDVITDDISEEYGINWLSSRYVNATVTGDTEVSLPADGEKSFTVNVDFSNDDINRNMFIEGWVKLTDPTDSNPDLSVPFVGFYGDWDEPRILDDFDHEEDGNSYYEMAGMLNTDWNFYEGAPAISPGTIYGQQFATDTVLPLPSFLRNAEKVEYNILNENGIKLRTIRSESFVRKNYVDGGRYNPYSLNPMRTWDGTAKGKLVADGLYNYQIRTKVQGGGWQEKLIPVYVDTIAPVISDFKYNDMGYLTWTAIDVGTGIKNMYVYINDVLVEIIVPEENETEFDLNIKEEVDVLLDNGKDIVIEVVAADSAWNLGYSYIYDVSEADLPHIYLIEPELLGTYNNSGVYFEGYILNNDEIEYVKINGEDAEFMYFDNAIAHLEGTPDQVIVPGYRFEHVLDLADGYHQIKVEAKSSSGETSIVRRFLVDSTNPILGVVVKNRYPNSATAELDITMSDNMQELTLFVFDSQEFSYDGSDTLGSIATPSAETTTVIVDLDLGENLIPITLIDIAGNKTTAEVSINRREATDEEVVAFDKEALEIIYAIGDSSSSVTQDVGLLSDGLNGSTITWSSDDENVIANDGTVILPVEDTVVTLIATLTKGVATETKIFKVTVKAETNPLIGEARIGYGEQENLNLIYVLFDLKDGYKDMTISVKVDGIPLGIGSPKEGFEFCFDGQINGAPTLVIITIGGVDYDISNLFELIPLSQHQIMKLIEDMDMRI